MKQIIYFYLMNDKFELIKNAAQRHAAYWKKLNLTNYQGGPFEDKSGGCITFLSSSMEQTTELILNDPFLKAGCLEKNWIKEWIIDH
jgi:uncharacterized protein YciI